MSLSSKGLAYKVSALIITVMGLFAIVVLVAGLYMSQRINTTRDQMEVELDDQLRIERLHSDSQALISDLRAFLAFGRDEFIADFDTRRAEFSDQLVTYNMSQLGSQEPKKIKLLESVQTTWDAYVLLAKQSAELKKADDTDQIVKNSESMTTKIDSINTSFFELSSLKESRVEKLLNDNRRETRLMVGIPIFVVLGSAVAGWFLVRFLKKRVIVPLIEVEQAVGQIAAGSYVQVTMNGRVDELGRLTSGINGMSIELQQRHIMLEHTNKELTDQRDLLEAQNEEITAQQLEQEDMLLKLTDRERELEHISSYQEKLTGFTDMQMFLEHSLRALLYAVGMDAAVLIKPNTRTGTYDVLHANGFPPGYLPSTFDELFGVSRRVLTEKKPIIRTRQLSERERGIHFGYETAVDIYYPLLDEKQELMGLLLLTSYSGLQTTDASERMTSGLVRQFTLAYMAQMINEDRRKQAELLEELNDELSQEKESLQEQRDFVRQIVESVHEGMVMTDSDGGIKFTNGWMSRTFGIEESRVFTIRGIIDSLHPKLGTRGTSMRLLAESVLSGKLDKLQEKFTIVQEDGRESHYELYVNAVQDSAESGKSYLFVFRDRTDEEKSDELKNEFISIVSHELRTPLASILGFMEILLHRDIQKEKQRKYMETIYKEANRLSSLINDFLDLQRMESGKQSYQFIPIHIATILRDVADQWQGKHNHLITLTLPESGEAIVLADHDRMTQVIHNLLSNAIKYSPSADRVDIRVLMQQNQVVIEIQDYGLGIPDNAKDKMFAKFYRVDNSDRRQIGGTGLGLSIVKEIVESHQGTLTYESILGQGTTFRVCLDAYETVDLDNHIVIVEDDENLAKLIAVSFEKLQLPTVHLQSAEAAIFALKETAVKPPLLCIVDIQLEGHKSGWDFIAELIRRPGYEFTPIIVSTVLEQPKHFHETETEKFLKKPFTVERLLELAEHLINRGKEHSAVVFPVQNEQKLANSFEQLGIRVKGMKVNQDIIEVEVNNDEKAT